MIEWRCRVLRKLLKIFNVKERQDFSGLYTDALISFAEDFPEVPKPEPRLSHKLLAAQWVRGDLRPEEMPSIAAELLENGKDSPALRRLAGEMHVFCRADVEEIVGRVFEELWASYPISETQAKMTLTRQIAREVIAGERDAWAAASHLEIVIWGRKAENTDLQTILDLRDQLNWDNANRGQIPTLTEELIKAFARLGALTAGEKRMKSLGALEGEGWIADDFDAPLPDELLAQFEGRDKPDWF
jgi:hypothetical protein